MEKRLSPEVKAVLIKLPSPDLVTLVDEVIARDNNNNNFALAERGKEELLQSVAKLPTEAIRDVLRTHGVL